MRATGFRAARAKSRRRAKSLDANTAAAIATTITEVQRDGSDALASMTTRRTGKLERFYKKALREGGAVGLVGYITAAARRSAFYARFIHDGTSKMRARPFHDQAVLSAEGKHRARMRRAQKRAVAGKGVSSRGRNIT